MITKNQLAIKLSKLKQVDNPKLKLEQYQTTSELASEILWHAFLNGNIEDKIIADFGCGNGIFAYGALLLGAKKVYCVDKDIDSLEIAKFNIKDKKAIFIDINVKYFDEEIDTVIQNPPFGTKEKHSDILFLKKAINLANSIYTLHKTSTKNFIKSLVKHDFKVESLDFKFQINHSFKFHKKPTKSVDVTLFVLKRNL
jgi:putative methylase